VYIIVIGVLVVAAFRRRWAGSHSEPELAPDQAKEKRVGNIVKVAVAVTVLTLFSLMVYSFRAGRAIDDLSHAAEPLSIKVTGQQWWWQVEYQDPIASKMVTTANEIHVPVGRPIKVELISHDVIHSFWVPNLHGKKDLVPNYPATIYFQADKPGMYWGQCAEFCGYEHAKMRFVVIAESPEDFDAWRAAASLPATAPQTEEQGAGQRIFMTTSCAQCHTISGTSASGRVGPNLSHVASRAYIAAGTLENTRDHLQNWVSDPQAIKPGTRMPMNTYPQEELDAIVAYLQSLK
jgi:cytochrome c oxidase subunit 2